MFPSLGEDEQLASNKSHLNESGVEKEKANKSSAKKFYKIKYTLNILPATTYEDGESRLLNDLME